ncbi:NAD(P)-dependent alcohol dehydrogenase [Microbacterium aoyamense]|uniref:NAD(P)-dependent alcohol dehydrogenase n=1 Tax=Microbacterium aoyamense TaxID=344166 RepID=A0ABN2PPJ1_9MICO|nr:NAD(P)-dependent alcohol dehydrogenase [Microbacterium aoyamense]
MTINETRTETMRAAAFHRFGGPQEVALERVTRPVPASHEVLVRVHYASVSIADHRVRARDVPRGLKLPVTAALGWRTPKHPVLGMDASGVVEQVGADVTDFAPGDRVVLLRGARFGCHAEFVTVRAAGSIARIPDELSLQDAATVPFGFGTARTFLDTAGVAPGQKVLVNGASGAVGSAAVQLAVRAGAIVTGVTSARNAEIVRGLGATDVVDYARADFTDAGPVYDIVVECVGNAPYARSRRAIVPGGALLLVITDLVGMTGAKLRPVRGGIRRIESVGVITGAMLGDLAARMAAGEIQPVLDRVFEFDDIRAAHEYVDTGRKRGTVLVRIGQSPSV